MSNAYKDYHMTALVPRQREWTFRRVVASLQEVANAWEKATTCLY